LAPAGYARIMPQAVLHGESPRQRTIERHFRPDGARHATSTNSISVNFGGNARRQQSEGHFFPKGLARFIDAGRAHYEPR
jgi:hypothetical protein